MAPTGPGPQPGTTGGEVFVWTTQNFGQSWRKETSLTPNATRNHTYVRRPLDAHPGFYALWADGDPLDDLKASHFSRLYFATKTGAVFTLPEAMPTETASPVPYRYAKTS
jgi:hypothetical protein